MPHHPGRMFAIGNEGFKFQPPRRLGRRRHALRFHRRLPAINWPANQSPTLLTIDPATGFPAPLGAAGRAKVAGYLSDFGRLPVFQQVTRLQTLFEPGEIEGLLHPDVRGAQQDHPLSGCRADAFCFEEILALPYQHWLPDWSLIRQDKNAMAHLLAYRAPFLDHRLIDFALGCPQAAQIERGNKVLWRRLAARHLPTSVTRRPKQPFYLPLEHPAWRAPLIALACQVLTPEAVSRHGWLRFSAIEPRFAARTFVPLKQLAALVILQLWLDSLSA